MSGGERTRHACLKAALVSYHNTSGARVGRVSSDTVWPLRRADGTTWAQSPRRIP